MRELDLLEMNNLNSNYKFVLYSVVFAVLFDSTWADGRHRRPLLNRHVARLFNSNSAQSYSNLPSANPNWHMNSSHYPSPGNQLYPSLQGIDPLFDSFLIPNRGQNDTRFPNWNVNPNFPNRNQGYNITHYPTSNFPTPMVDPYFYPGNWNKLPPQGSNYPSGWNGNFNLNGNQYKNQPTTRNPSDFSNFIGPDARNNDPLRPHNIPYQPNGKVNATTDRNLAVEDSLPIARTTCGKTLCSYTPNYPTTEINSAVERARNTLRSGVQSATLRTRGITLQTFNSITIPTTAPSNTVSGNQMTSFPGHCKKSTQTSHPHEGFSSDDSQTYFVVNVPSLTQGLSETKCESANDQAYGMKVAVPSWENQSCRQIYRKEKLLVLPIGKRTYNIDDFQLKMFHVPADCSFMAPRKGY